MPARKRTILMMKPMNRRAFIRRASLGMAAAAGVPTRRPAADGSARGPNIVYVFADQMRHHAMACAGNPVVKTPNLDAMAAQGMLLTNAFSCSPVCSPYRAQLLTGRYGHVTGVTNNDIRLPDEEETLAEVLKQRGYATGYIGKWHLDAGRKEAPGTPRKNGFVPPDSRQGFDYWAVHECTHLYFNRYYFRDSPEPVHFEGYEPDVQTDLAIAFMEQHQSGPFCLMLSYGPPHNPYKPPEAFDLYKPEDVPLRPNVPKEAEDQARAQIAQYYGLVTSLDHNIGRLAKAMDELGLADNTVFCFSSDHGDMLHSQGQTLKQKPWEESVHIPFILRYPSRVTPDQRKDVLFASVDVMPTLLGLCDAPIPGGVQGRDLSDVFLGKSADEPESVFLSINGAGRNTGLHAPWRGVRTREWVYAWSAGLPGPGHWVLYNVKEDPYELNNLVNDPEHRDIRTKLHAMTEQWRKDTGDNLDLDGILSESRER
jgi:arylsulfatase A-like enzyme